MDPGDQLPCLTARGGLVGLARAEVAGPLAPPSVTRLEKSKATPTARKFLTQSLKRLFSALILLFVGLKSEVNSVGGKKLCLSISLSFIFSYLQSV